MRISSPCGMKENFFFSYCVKKKRNDKYVFSTKSSLVLSFSHMKKKLSLL